MRLNRLPTCVLLIINYFNSGAGFHESTLSLRLHPHYYVSIWKCINSTMDRPGIHTTLVFLKSLDWRSLESLPAPFKFKIFNLDRQKQRWRHRQSHTAFSLGLFLSGSYRLTPFQKKTSNICLGMNATWTVNYKVCWPCCLSAPFTPGSNMWIWDPTALSACVHTWH